MPSRDPIKRFTDIIANIEAIANSIAGMSKDEFFEDPDKYDAAERRLARISEAANKLGLLAEQLAPNQPRNNIRGIGNWLRHDYPNIFKETIWETIAHRCEVTAKEP